MKKLRKEISEFYKKIFSNAVFKDKIKEKAKKVVTEADLRNLIREEIMPLMKKENLNCSEEDLLKYEEETLKSLSKEDLTDVSGGVSIKSALLTGGILSMALFGSLNANAMDVDPFASNPQPARGSSQQPNNSNNNANQPGNNGNNNNGDGNNAANNNDRARAWRNRLYGLLNNLPPDVQRWATSLSLIEKGLIVSDGNYLFFRDENGSVSPLLSPGVTILAVSPTVWDINGTRYTVNRISRLNGPGAYELAEIEEIITYQKIKNLTIAPQCFADNKKLRRVELKNVYNLTIEKSAFSGCEGLSEFALNNFAKVSIYENAFVGCRSLAKFILSEDPKNVSIKEDAFVGCKALNKTLLVEKYGYVEPSANINNDTGAANKPASQDRNVSVSNRNINNFSPIDKNAYSENATFRYFEGRLSNDVKNSKEFREAMKTGWLLESGECLLSFKPPSPDDLFTFIYLYVPDDVNKITINAKARNIIFGNKHIFPNYRLEKIYGGKNLKKIKLGSDIENFEFGMDCCEKREVLEEVDASGAYNLEVSLTAFYECKNLKKFTGAEKTKIYSGAFLDCTSLCEVILPADASVADDAFKGCTSLKGILLLEKNSNNVHTANINNYNGTVNNPAPQDSDNGNNKHPKQFSRPYISASTILLPSEPASQNTNNNEPDNDNINDSPKADLFAFSLVAHDIITGSPDYNENTENKNDASDQHNDNSNNNESVDEYNDEDYSVDIDEIMASQIRAFGKNPEMRVLDRNAAIKIANDNDAASNASPQDSNNGSSNHNENIENKNDAANDTTHQDSSDESSDHNGNIENKNDAASNASPQDSNNGASDHDENTKNKNNDKVPYIQKNANGKIIFVIPIWCDVIKGWAFDYSANIANPEEQARFKKMIESVEILVVPPNVKEISHWAFRGWPNLKKIIFIDGWPQLHGYSFGNCRQLKKVESIGDSSNRQDVTSSKSFNPFTSCDNLEGIDVADNVIYERSLIVDTNDHEYGKKLKKISMPKRAQIYFSENKGSGDSPEPIPTEELLFPNGSSCRKFEISSWTKLEKLDVPVAFNGESSENELLINVWRLGSCDSLKKINIRGDVKVINKSDDNGKKNNIVSIRNCPKLEEVTFPPSLEYVGGDFDDLIKICPNLKKITFLSERIYFGKKSFSQKDFPDLVKEPDSLEVADFFSFADYFPDGCEICLPYAKEIYVDGKKYDIPNDNPDNAIEIVKINYNERDNYDEDVTIIDDKNKICFVFQKVLDKKDAELMLNGFIPGWDAKNRVISCLPKYYCKVGEKAFKDNGSIEYVGIPVSVKEIANEAFANCANLEVFASKYIPKFGNKAFDGCTKLEKVAACSEGVSKKIMAEQNLAEVFSNCPNFKGIELIPEHDYFNDIAFFTIDQVKSWDSKNFGGIIISNENVYFEKGFFSSEYFPEGFKIYLLDPKEICVDCEKIPITKEEDNSSKDNHDEEDSDYEDNFQYNVGEKIPLPENINSSGVVSEEEEEEEEALEKGIILIKTNPEKEKGLNPTSNPILKYGWRIESYSD